VAGRAAIGIRAHSGWAVLVALSADAQPLLRRRIELVEGSGFRSGQPYHAAAEMQLHQAVTFLSETRRVAALLAARQVKAALEALARDGWKLEDATVLRASGRPLPELGRILSAHPLIHTAEGEFFRDAMKAGCESCGLRVTGVPEREVMARCGAAMQARVAAMGKQMGSPWRQDEKLSAAAAWLVLAGDAGAPSRRTAR
jgi:hypothetical protein